MKNKLKRKIPDSSIREIFDSNSLGKVIQIEPLSGGEFNSVWKVVTENNQYVIKIPPANDVKVLTYEKDIISSEYFATKEFEKVSAVHIPRVVAFSDSYNTKFKYIILEFVDGEVLSSVNLSENEYNQVIFDLGKAVAQMHNIKSNLGFGYLQNGLKSTWETAYMSMINNIIFDAETIHAKIPYLSEIKSIIEKCKPVLNEVTVPIITHFDLWQGNIFIKNKKLHSIIDCERIILGDPLGDFIHLDFLSPFDVHKNKYLIDGYNSVAENKLIFNRNELIRLYLIRIYLGLIVAVEPYYRFSRFDLPFYYKRAFAKKFLRVSLDELNKLTKGK